MTLKAEALLQTPITYTPFPTTAPYKRDKLAFAHSYIDEMLKWQKLCAEELQQLDATKWCFDKGYGRMYAIVIEDFKKEFLGEN